MGGPAGAPASLTLLTVPGGQMAGSRSDLARPSHSQSCCRSGSPRPRARTLMAHWPWRPGLQKSCPVSCFVIASNPATPPAGSAAGALATGWGGSPPTGAEQAGGVRSPLPPGALGCSCSSRGQAVHPPGYQLLLRGFSSASLSSQCFMC